MEQVTQPNLSLEIFKIQLEKIFIHLDSANFKSWSGKGVKVTSQSNFQLEWFSSILGSEGSFQNCHKETLSFHQVCDLNLLQLNRWSHLEEKSPSIISTGQMTN